VAREGDFPATPLRRRLLIAGLAVTTAVTLILMMLERVGAPPLPRPPSTQEQVGCAAGQSTGCVGGKADVILLPARPAASTPSGTVAERRP